MAGGGGGGGGGEGGTRNKALFYKISEEVCWLTSTYFGQILSCSCLCIMFKVYYEKMRPYWGAAGRKEISLVFVSFSCTYQP